MFVVCFNNLNIFNYNAHANQFNMIRDTNTYNAETNQFDIIYDLNIYHIQIIMAEIPVISIQFLGQK